MAADTDTEPMREMGGGEKYSVMGSKRVLKRQRRVVLGLAVFAFCLLIIVAVLITLLLTIRAKHFSANQDAKAEIIARNDEYRQLRLAGQMDKLYDFYTEDCKVMAQGRDVIDGIEALRSSKLKERLTQIAGDILLDTDEVVAFGTKAVERGHYTLIKDDGSMIDRGNYLVLWTKDSGIWMMHMEIFNSIMKK